MKGAGETNRRTAVRMQLVDLSSFSALVFFFVFLFVSVFISPAETVRFSFLANSKKTDIVIGFQHKKSYNSPMEYRTDNFHFVCSSWLCRPFLRIIRCIARTLPLFACGTWLYSSASCVSYVVAFSVNEWNVETGPFEIFTCRLHSYKQFVSPQTGVRAGRGE